MCGCCIYIWTDLQQFIEASSLDQSKNLWKVLSWSFANENWLTESHKTATDRTVFSRTQSLDLELEITKNRQQYLQYFPALLAI